MLNPQCTTASACSFIPSIHTKQAGVAENLMEMKSLRKLVQWLRGEFEAAPHLRLTTREAAACLGLDLDTAQRVLSQLFRAGFLRQYADDRYGVVAGA